jgi:hypothetical protein
VSALPFATPEESSLPARRGYVVVEDELQKRLEFAKQMGRTAVTNKMREYAESLLAAVWRDIEAYETERMESEAQAAFDAEFPQDGGK